MHTASATVANVHDVEKALYLIREDDEVFYGDSAYLGIKKHTMESGNGHLISMALRIIKKPSSLKTTHIYKGSSWEKFIEYQKSSV